MTSPHVSAPLRTRMSTILAQTRIVATLQAAFERECLELGLQARLTWPEGHMTAHFEPQFGAESDWLARTFREELENRGFASDPDGVSALQDEARLDAGVERLRAALRRTRSRLVDTDSWVSGGVPWPFPVDDPVVAARALATYRAPARANAAVAVSPGRVTISVPAGDCGAVVSAGIWVPTAVAGDFELTVEYSLDPWTVGERESCLGLFAVSPDGTFRMYAQRVAQPGVATHVVADLQGTLGPIRAPTTGPLGALRIRRDRGLLTAWHRELEWTWLGRLREPAPLDLIVGIKVWAVGRTGELHAELRRFDLSCKASAAQTPPPPSRPDPRQAPAPVS